MARPWNCGFVVPVAEVIAGAGAGEDDADATLGPVDAREEALERLSGAGGWSALWNEQFFFSRTQLTQGPVLSAASTMHRILRRRQ